MRAGVHVLINITYKAYKMIVMNMRKKYIKPTVKVAEIDGDLMLLQGSASVGGPGSTNPGSNCIFGPSDEEGDQ